MRAWAPALFVVAACRGDAPAPHPVAKLVAPKVEVASVLGPDDARPPFLVIVDEHGNAHLAAAATWGELDAGRVKIARATPLEPLDRFLREEIAFGKASVASIKRWDDYSLTPLAFEEPPLSPEDDPPPPEEEDKPDDGVEESGGTGTTIMLDDGTLGKKELEREEGQYTMIRTPEDPQLARQQAIEQARAAGTLLSTSGTYSAFGPPSLKPDGTPSRVAEVSGVFVTGPLEDVRAMVLVPPAAKAMQLFEIVRDLHYAIAVMHTGKLRPLRIRFGLEVDWYMPDSWLEVRVSANSIVVEAVPDKAIEVADLKGLSTALDEARAPRSIDPDAQVDLLLDANLDAQRLVDVLVALDTAGVRAVGLGPMPASDQLERRGRRIALMMIGQPNAQGDLEKRLIRRTVKQNSAKLRACYEWALRFIDPTLRGTVSTQFFITPSGTVTSASAYGVHSQVAGCIADVVKTLEFPKPKGGGGVQVNYPFTFRP